jgi:DNA-binding LacI/PurR family transcriptional regulator
VYSGVQLVYNASGYEDRQAACRDRSGLPAPGRASVKTVKSQPVPRRQRRQEVLRKIQSLIRVRRLWGRRLMGERELEATLGVCRTTVRRVLADLERENVIERRHGAGTFVSERARAKGHRRTRRLAIVALRRYAERPGWDFRKEIVLGLLDQSKRSVSELTFLSLDSPEERDRIRSSAEMRRFDGFIAVGLDDHEILACLAELDRGPVVLLDGYVRGLPVTTVVDNGFDAMRATTRHLLALGHRRIAFIDCHNRAVNNPEKFAGYRAALAEKGIVPDDELMAVPDEPDDLYAVDAGDWDAPSVGGFVSRSVERFLGLAAPPTAILGFDDRRAYPALQELERRGLRVGTNYSVAGCGDQAVRRGVTDRLTSARIYPRQMGREALRAACEPGRAGEGRTILVPARLFIRQSTCPPPHNRKGQET